MPWEGHQSQRFSPQEAWLTDLVGEIAGCIPEGRPSAVEPIGPAQANAKDMDRHNGCWLREPGRFVREGRGFCLPSGLSVVATSPSPVLVLAVLDRVGVQTQAMVEPVMRLLRPDEHVP